MIKNVIGVGLLLISALLGYVAYPIINSSQREQSSDDNFMSVIEEPKTTLDSRDSILQNKSQENLNIEPLDTKETNLFNQDELTSSGSLEEITQSNNFEVRMSEEDKIIAQELNDWAESHKKILYDLIESKLPEKAASNLKKLILIQNQSIEPRTVYQDAVLDEAWAYQMEQTLNDLIMQYEPSYGTEIVNITCKQLICEVLGINHAEPTLLVLQTTIRNHPLLINILDSVQTRMSSTIENNRFYVYFQLTFK
jgi:hypothetical protein